MILLGASGHAKVIIDILEKSGQPIEGLYDTNPELTSLAGKPVLQQSELSPRPDQEAIVCIGDNRIRKMVVKGLSMPFGTAIHASVQLGADVNIGGGTVVMAGAVINPSTNIGDHCIINTTASIDHDCEIGNYVHISPNSTLCGGISVGEGTHIGAGATIIPNIKIGKWAVIGAGAVVIADVPDFAVVVGNPARIIKSNEPTD